MYGKKLSKALLATAAAGAMAVGLSSSAMAGAKAFSSLQVTNFAVYHAIITPGMGGAADTFSKGAIVDISDLSFLNAIDTTFTSAELNGASDMGASSSLLKKCVGAMCGSIAEDDFGMISPTGSLGNFARSDVADSGAIISGTAAGSPATGQTVAEVQLVSTSTGQSDSKITNSSGIIFAMLNSGRLWVEFDAELMMTAALNPDAVVPGSGTEAAANFGINLEEVISGTEVFVFNPDGSATGDEQLDPYSLTSLTVEDLIPDAIIDENIEASQTFVSVTPLLSANLAYTLGIQHTVSANANKLDATKVAEPATLAILGLGLLGLGATSRRRRQLAK